MSRQFDFHPSRRLAGLLSAAHGAALAVLPALALPAWAALLMAAVLVFSLLYFLRGHAWLRSPSSCIGLTQDGDGGILLLTRDGSRIPCCILPDSVVTPALTVLNIRVEGARGTRGIVILSDSMDAGAFRRLRVWLRHGGDQAAR